MCLVNFWTCKEPLGRAQVFEENAWKYREAAKSSLHRKFDACFKVVSSNLKRWVLKYRFACKLIDDVERAKPRNTKWQKWRGIDYERSAKVPSWQCGRGGFIRSNWQELNQLIAAATSPNLFSGDVDGFTPPERVICRRLAAPV
ncbi:hypothetical protein ECZU28_06130 [Escherichia coli]|nr:hypothetical protein ECZU28_06130 [Escherichia coli]